MWGAVLGCNDVSRHHTRKNQSVPSITRESQVVTLAQVTCAAPCTGRPSQRTTQQHASGTHMVCVLKESASGCDTGTQDTVTDRQREPGPRLMFRSTEPVPHARPCNCPPSSRVLRDPALHRNLHRDAFQCVGGQLPTAGVPLHRCTDGRRQQLLGAGETLPDTATGSPSRTHTSGNVLRASLRRHSLVIAGVPSAEHALAPATEPGLKQRGGCPSADSGATCGSGTCLVRGELR